MLVFARASTGELAPFLGETEGIATRREFASPGTTILAMKASTSQ